MTADDARRVTAERQKTVESKVQIVLELWFGLINEAADRGERRVREEDLPTVRTPIPAAAFDRAREDLKNRGFKVQSVATGPNESDWEVSW